MVEGREVSAEVLGHILLLQSQLHLEDDEKAMAEALCRGLERVPGVRAVAVCREGSIAGGGVNDFLPPENCRLHFSSTAKPEKCFPRCHFEQSGANRIRLALQATQTAYGGILVEVGDRETFDAYRPYLDSLARAAALLIANRRQRESLEAVNRDLEAEVQKRIAETRFQAGLLDQIGDLITATDLEGRITYVNRAVFKQRGQTREELMGQSVEEYGDDPEQGATQREIVETVREKGEWSGQVVNEIPSGDRLLLHSRVWMVRDEEGRPSGMCGVATDVTEQNRMMERLRELSDRLELILESAEVGAWDWDIRSGDLELNRQWAHMLGYAPEDIRPHVSTWEDLVHPDDMHQVRRVLEAHLAGDTPIYETEHRLRHRQGHYVWVLDRGKVIERDALGNPLRAVGTHVDITAVKEAERETRRSRQHLHQILESLSDGFFALDNDLVVTYFNRAASELLGRPAEEVVGKPLFDAFPEARGSIFEENYRRALQKREMIEFETFFDADPYTDWYAVRVYPYAEGISVFFQVVTERKQAEEERRRLDIQMQQTQKLESLGVLAGGIAHDFNNLLMGVLGNCDLAQMELSPASPAQAYLQDVEAAARRAAGLCQQMLAYSGKGHFVIEDLSLNDIVEEMTHMLEISISKHAVLKMRLASNLPPVRADATQVRQVVMNLVINASEAIGEKSGVISITTGTMECDQDYLRETYLDEELSAGRYVFLEVADTGCGMDDETRQRMFDPFFTTKFTGRGLGMAAVLGILRGHRGAVKVYSEEGEGTTIKVLMPASGQEQGYAQRRAKSRPAAEWHGGGTILLVDDERSVVLPASRMLKRMGFEVLAAHDGREALDIYHKNADHIVCVVLDLTMPHMGGEDTFRELRRLRGDLPVLISSGYSEQDVAQRFLGKGISGFMQKPYQLSALREKLKEILTGAKGKEDSDQ